MANVNIEQLNIKINFVGMVENEEWPHFLWNVIINDKVNFDFKTGLGLIETKKLMTFQQPNISGSKVNSKLNFIVNYNNKFYKAIVIKNRVDSWLSVTPKMPTKSDILHALILDAEALDDSFINWCDNFGYDSDSIKALNIYNLCCEYGKKLKSCFSNEEIKNIAEQLQDY